jgi:hypothetical protein
MSAYGNQNVFVSTFALSNVVEDIHQDVIWSSNSLASIANVSQLAAQIASASNNAVWASNQLSPWSSNTASWSSNVCSWLSNNSVIDIWLSNTLLTTSSNVNNLSSNFYNYIMFASNTHVWTSNSLSNFSAAASNGIFASNAVSWTSNYLSNLASSNGQSNWNYASNAVSWTSNYLSNLASSNGQSNWNYASNAVSWTSNYLSNLASSNGQSNWNYASNTATWTSNTATWTSNTTTWTSNTATWTSNTLSNYAMSNGQSNWNFASNTSVWTSNSLSNYAFSNRQSNWNYASNVATWTSNNTSNNYWVSSSSNVTTTCNVGIGTTTPRWPCTIQGGFGIIDGVNAADNGGAVQFGAIGPTYSPMSTLSGVLYDINLATTTAHGGLSFATRPSIVGSNTTIVERMRVTHDGKVGVGTTTPNRALEVHNGEVCTVQPSSTNAIVRSYRMVYGNYGTFWVQNSNSVSFMSTTFNNQYGGGSPYVPFLNMLDTTGTLGGYMVGDVCIANYTLNVRNALPTNYGGLVGINMLPSGLYDLELANDKAGKPGTNTWTISSDERLKENIELADLDTCYSNVKNIPLKYYKWRDDVYTDKQVSDRHKLGWIAQDVETVFPKAVDKGEMHGYLDCRTLNSDQIYASMYGAIQKLQHVYEATKQELDDLKAVVAAMQK